MPTSYIQISKESTFPSASSAGKAVIGINTGSKVTITNSSGVTSLVPESLPPGYTASYNVYTAKLTTLGGLILPIEISSGPTTADVIYQIIDASDGDFSNIGAPDNNTGTNFVSTGGTPISYGSATLVQNPYLPTAIVQENTLGFRPLWEYIGSGEFGFTFSGSFDPTKVVASISPNSTNNLFSYFVVGEDYDVNFFVRNVDNNPETLTQTPIEIRQYL
jgi:hypothetical protein